MTPMRRFPAVYPLPPSSCRDADIRVSVGTEPLGITSPPTAEGGWSRKSEHLTVLCQADRLSVLIDLNWNSARGKPPFAFTQDIAAHTGGFVKHTWPMAGMRASTKGMAASFQRRSATATTLATPSRTSSSASFSSCTGLRISCQG